MLLDRSTLEIDYDNPLSRGLAFAIVHSGGGIFDLVGQRSSESGLAVQTATRAGFAQRFTTFAVLPGAITTSNPDGTGDFTMLSYASPVSSGVRHALVSSAASTTNQAYLIANCNSTYNGSPGRISFFGYPMGGVSVAEKVDGSPHVFLGMRAGAVGYLDVDGVELAANSVGTASIWNAGNRLSIGGIYGYSGYLDVDAPHHLTLAWNRALSKAERISIGHDPSQVLRSRDDDSILYSLPSGPISVSWSSLTASNITQTSATLTLGGIVR